MQTLGLSDSTPRTENRLKSLFWPSIQSEADVDYLGAQGYWICTAIGLLTVVVSVATAGAIIGTLTFVFFYLGGVGIRRRSRYAAAVVLTLYVLDLLASGPNFIRFLSPGIVLRVVVTAILLSNLRATWLAAKWPPSMQDAEPPAPASRSWSDRFVDDFPAWLWPKIRVVYYAYSGVILFLTALGVVAILRRAIPVR